MRDQSVVSTPGQHRLEDGHRQNGAGIGAPPAWGSRAGPERRAGARRAARLASSVSATATACMAASAHRRWPSSGARGSGGRAAPWQGPSRPCRRRRWRPSPAALEPASTAWPGGRPAGPTAGGRRGALGGAVSVRLGASVTPRPLRAGSGAMTGARSEHRRAAARRPATGLLTSSILSTAMAALHQLSLWASTASQAKLFLTWIFPILGVPDSSGYGDKWSS